MRLRNQPFLFLAVLIGISCKLYAGDPNEIGLSVELHFKSLKETSTDNEEMIHKLDEFLHQNLDVHCPIRWQFSLLFVSSGGTPNKCVRVEPTHSVQYDYAAGLARIVDVAENQEKVRLKLDLLRGMSPQTTRVIKVKTGFLLCDPGEAFGPLRIAFLPSGKSKSEWRQTVKLADNVSITGPTVPHTIEVRESESSVMLFGNASQFFYGVKLASQTGELMWAFDWFVDTRNRSSLFEAGGTEVRSEVGMGAGSNWSKDREKGSGANGSIKGDGGN